MNYGDVVKEPRPLIFCKDCKWFLPDRVADVLGGCSSPANYFERRVFGPYEPRVEIRNYLCEELNGDNNCRLYEPKPSDEQLSSNDDEGSRNI